MATDNELFIILVNRIEFYMAAKSLDVDVVKAQQQQLQDINPDNGTSDLPQVFIYKLRDKRYGWKKNDNVYNEDNGEFDTSYIQQMETVFQLWTMRRSPAGSSTYLTASDYLNEVVEVLQSPEFIDDLWRDNEVGIQRVIDLPSSYIIDDKDQYEDTPRIEFTLTHKRITTRQVPEVTSFEASVNRV